MFIFTFTRRRVGKAILLPLSGGEFTGNHPARQINRLAFLDSPAFLRGFLPTKVVICNI